MLNDEQLDELATRHLVQGGGFSDTATLNQARLEGVQGVLRPVPRPSVWVVAQAPLAAGLFWEVPVRLRAHWQAQRLVWVW